MVYWLSNYEFSEKNFGFLHNPSLRLFFKIDFQMKAFRPANIQNTSFVLKQTTNTDEKLKTLLNFARKSC